MSRGNNVIEPRIRVFLAEENALLREGLGMLLQVDGDIEVVGDVVPGAEASSPPGETIPYVVVASDGSTMGSTVLPIVMVSSLGKEATGMDLRQAVRRAAGAPQRSGVSLTGRETEILVLIANSNSNREIAERLHISVKTVDTHRMHLMSKLDIHDVAGLTRYAIRRGLITHSG